MDGFKPESASDRTAGPIFAAQPQVRASPVSVFFLNSVMDLYSFRVICPGYLIDAFMITGSSMVCHFQVPHPRWAAADFLMLPQVDRHGRTIVALEKGTVSRP